MQAGVGTDLERWADCYGDGATQVRVRVFGTRPSAEQVGTVEQVRVVVLSDRTVVQSFGTPSAAEIIAVVGGDTVPVTP